MKIGVFGSCQSVGMAASISALVPDAEVHRFVVDEARIAGAETITAKMNILSECDHVFIQPSLAHGIKGLLPDDFAARCKNIIPYPFILCRFLQPDCHYLPNDKGAFIEGPLGPYQSGIAAGAYLSGLSLDRAISLFNMFTYRKLGYLDFDPEDEPISREARRFEYDFGAFLKGEHGHFMHTINHPKISILFETARQSLNKAGISYDKSAVLPNDSLSQNSVWPVYPALAKSFVSEGEEIRFRRPRMNTDLSLPEFVEASYEAFHAANGAFCSALSDKVKTFIATYVV
jgi:hypothetical protein